MFKNALILIVLSAGISFGAQPSNINAFFREGQTFITWDEDNGQSGERYRIYRSTSEITDLGSADLVAEIDEGSSTFEHMHNCDGSMTESDPYYIDRFIIQPVESGTGTMLAEDRGLFVWTSKEEAATDIYYAVTTVSPGGTEETVLGSGNRFGPVSEVKQHKGAVRYHVDSKKDYYTMWLDYELYGRKAYNGYAFPFAITRDGFSVGGKHPKLHLDGIGTHFPGNDYSYYGNSDYSGNGTPTWYFGYHMNEDYDGKCNPEAGYNMQDTIANYVMYQHMQSVLWARRHYNITHKSMHVVGNSMGASGVFGLILYYPSFITSGYSNQGLSQYPIPGVTSSGGLMWQSSVWANYGDTAFNNPAKFLPFNDPDYPGLDWVTQFNGQGIYDVRDAVKFMRDNMHISFGFLQSGHGSEDGSIQYEYNGEKLEQWLADSSRQTFSYHYRYGGVHNWNTVYGSLANRDIPMMWDESRPGFSNVPARPVYKYNYHFEEINDGDRGYCIDMKWGTRDNPIKKSHDNNGYSIEETETSWTLPIQGYLLSYDDSDEWDVYHVDITPRNLQEMKVCEGDTFTYEITDLSGSTVHSSGECVGDGNQLLLIPQVPIDYDGAIVNVVLKSRGPNYPCEKMDDPLTNIEGKKPGLTEAATATPGLSASPNPFNPNVKISLSPGMKYSLRTSGNIKIYSLDGRMVREFSIDRRIANTASVVWNGRDMSGRKVSSGIYIVSASVDGKNISKKIVLQK